MARDTYGKLGYCNFLKLFGAAIPVAVVASFVLAFVPGLRIDQAAETGAIAVALILTFGLGYAFDASPDRVELYGQARETATAGVVLLFFLVAVTTLGSLMAYRLWPPGQEIALPWCFLGSDACRLLPPRFDPRPWFAWWGIVGLAVTLVGAAQLFVVLYRPLRLDPRYDSEDITGRRVLARLVDVLFLMAGVWVLFMVLWSVDRGVTGGWIVTAGLMLWAFLYEAWPLAQFDGRTVGKRLLQLRVVPARDDGKLSWGGPVVARAAITSLVYSFGTSFLLVVFLRASVDLTLGVQILLAVGLSASPVIHVRFQGPHDVLLDTRVVRHRKEKKRDTDADRRTGGHHGRLRLRPSEPANGGDLLERRTQMRVVNDVLRREAGPAVMMVNAPWGGGKTTFLKMCAAELQDSDVLVVEFNSWTQQYTTKPLLDLVGAISHQIQTRKETRADGDLKEFAEPLADVFGRSRSSRRLFASWDSAHESVRDFSTALSDIARQRRIVLLVDELDRCRADYALGTLEALRHLFSVEGVLAVVGVSRDELCHSIRSLYGERFDADAYLRRFADLQIDLPPPTHHNMTRFLEAQLQTSGLADRIQPGGSGILQLITEVEGCSLRDLQQATHLAALALLPDPPDEHPRTVWERCALAMIVLRTADREAYRQFARREIDSFAALAAANARFRPTVIGADPMLAVQRTQFEAALLNVGPAEFQDTADFKNRYQQAHRRAQLDVDLEEPLAGTGEGARQTLAALLRLRRTYPTPPAWRPLWVESIADRLDLLAD